MVISFWPDRNEMAFSFRSIWEAHFGQNEMKFILFLPEWNGNLILVRYGTIMKALSSTIYHDVAKDDNLLLDSML